MQFTVLLQTDNKYPYPAIIL